MSFNLRTVRSIINGVTKVMSDDPSKAASPSPASGAPPSKLKPIGRVLFSAFLPCFFWPPLTVVFSKLLQFGAIPVLWPVPVVIASVILYPACFTKSSPVFRAFMALLIGVALYSCAWGLWAGVFLLVLRPRLA